MLINSHGCMTEQYLLLVSIIPAGLLRALSLLNMAPRVTRETAIDFRSVRPAGAPVHDI